MVAAMHYIFRPFQTSSCEENARSHDPDLVARYARICADPLIWPLTAQAPRQPASFTRWLRRLVRSGG